VSSRRSPARRCWLELRGTSPVRATTWSAIVAPNVRRLDLSMLTLSEEDVEAVVAQPWPKLESLTLSWNRYNKHALLPLAKLAAPLRRFDCAAGHAGPSLGDAIGKFTGLTYLRIPGNEIGSAGLAAMLPALQHATHLDLRGNELVDADVPGLLGKSRRSVLKLGGNSLGPKAAEMIAAWPNAKHLTRLDLGAGIGERGARALAKSTQFSTKLEVLTLSGSGIPAEVGPALLASPQLANARIYVGFSMLGRKKLAAAAAKAAKAKAAKAKPAKAKPAKAKSAAKKKKPAPNKKK
jgi:hypothetical protein